MSASSISASYSCGPVHFLSLPDEMLRHAFLNLNFPDLQRSLLVCSKFKKIADDGELRRLLFEKDFSKRAPIANPNLLWKDQYKYAYFAESNFSQGRGCLSFCPHAHTCSIVNFKERGQHIFSSSRDEQLVISHPKMAEPQVFVNVLDGKFSFNEDDLMFVQEGRLKILKSVSEGEKYQEAHELAIDGSNIEKFHVEADSIYAKADNGAMRVWKKNGNEEVFALDDVRCLCPKGELLFLTTQQDALQIWKKKEAGSFCRIQLIKDASAGPFGVSELFFEGGHLIAGSFDGSFKVWKMGNDGLFTQVHAHVGKLFDSLETVTAWAVEGDCMILGTSKGQLQVFKNGNNETLQESQLLVHTDRINSIRLRNDRLSTASTDGSAKIWQRDSEGGFQFVCKMEGDSAATYVEVDGDRCITGYAGGSIEILDFSRT